MKKRRKSAFFAEAIIDSFRDIYLQGEDLPKYFDFYSGENELRNLAQKKNQIIFGRRGTGKSHCLKAFDEKINMQRNKRYSIYISCLDVVSGSSLSMEGYDQESKYKLIANLYYKNFLRKLVEELIKRTNDWHRNLKNRNIVENIFYNKILNEILNGSLCNCVQTSCKTIREISKTHKNAGASIDISKLFNAKLGASYDKANDEEEVIEQACNYSTDLSKVREGLDEYLKACGVERLYLCIDEWSELDKSCNTPIQQYFAQKLKQTFFKSPIISVKIASIWALTEMNDKSLYGRFNGGLEIGQDIHKSLDLDTLFFEDKASIDNFFKNLLYKRFINSCSPEVKTLFPKKEPEIFLIEEIFENKTNFSFLVSASHGVPRDFLMLLHRCLFNINYDLEHYAVNRVIIEEAAIGYYVNEKRNLISGNKVLTSFIETIDKYLEKHKERFFVISNDDVKRTAELSELVDKKFLHQLPSSLIDRSIRNKYKVFLIDYGCYWDWLKTKKIQADSEISPTLELSKEQIMNIEEYMLVDNGFLSYLRCKNEKCNRIIETNHPVYVEYHICPFCARKMEDSE